MRAIILAAGKSAVTPGPISNLDIDGIRLIDLQVSALRQAGADSIVVVTGHGADQVSRADIEIRRNDDWHLGGSVSSLHMVKDLFDGMDDVLIVYGDTLFESGLVQTLAGSEKLVSVLGILDAEGVEREVYREYVRLEGGDLKEVSDTRAPSAQGESPVAFTGLTHVRKGATRAFYSKFQNHDMETTTHIGSLLTRVARDGIAVGVRVACDGWTEVNTTHRYEQMLGNSILLGRVTQIHVDWTQRAKAYDKLDWVNNDVLLSSMVGVAREVAPKRLIDIGTGTGKVLLALHEVLKSSEAWGVDLSQAMLDRIEKRDGLILKCGNLETLADVPENYFDLSTARMVFHHINDTRSAMKNVYRMLRPGGRFIVCEGVPPTLRTVKWYTEMFRYKEDRKTLTEVDLINLLLDAGLENVQLKSIVMKRASLNNWLDNSGIPEENIRILKDMHFNAPDSVKEDYDMEFEGGDCLMTWRFGVVYGEKPLQ